MANAYNGKIAVILKQEECKKKLSFQKKIKEPNTKAQKHY
jgi:hypothetical protein